MKTIYFLVLFLLVFSVKAQITPILDHSWTIEQIDTGSQIITADLNPFGDYDNFTLVYVGEINTLTIYSFFLGNCGGVFSFNDFNSSFIYHDIACTLSNDDSSQIALYFNDIFIKQNTSIDTTYTDLFALSYGPLNYNFSTSGDTIYLHITNSIGEVATFYANNLSQDEFLKENITIYPNPAKNMLHIESSGIAIDTIKIYDLNGRLVLENKNVEHQINVSHLQQGVYILEVETAVGVLREKLVKVD